MPLVDVWFKCVSLVHCSDLPRLFITSVFDARFRAICTEPFVCVCVCVCGGGGVVMENIDVCWWGTEQTFTQQLAVNLKGMCVSGMKHCHYCLYRLYVFTFVCCVCVCVSERERERQR